MAGKKMEPVHSGDISNKVVVVVLVLVIVASVISLGVYLNAVEQAQPTLQDKSQGYVYLQIEKQPTPAVPVTEDAKVAVTIEKPPQ